MPSANSYNPGTTGGNREDLGDEIIILEPQETPVYSAMPRGKRIQATTFETLADTLKAASTAGTKEGQDAGQGSNKATNRARFANHAHRVMEDWSVTDVQEEISRNGGQAGLTDEAEYARMKCAKEMKRHCEAITLGAQEGQLGSESAMRTRGAKVWISSSAQSTNPVPENFRTRSGAIKNTGAAASFTEADVMAVLKAIWAVRGTKVSYLMPCGEDAGEEMDRFTRDGAQYDRLRVNVDGKRKELSLELAVYDCAFGRVMKTLSNFMAMDSDSGVAHQPDEAYFMHMPDWEIRELSPMHSKDLEDQGGGPRGYCKTIFGVGCKAPHGQGRFNDA